MGPDLDGDGIDAGSASATRGGAAQDGRVLVMGGSFWENYPVYVAELYRP